MCIHLQIYFTYVYICKYQGWAGIPVTNHSREYRLPIPLPKVWELVFPSCSRSQKLGMLYFIPVLKIRECNFPFPFPLVGMDYNVSSKVGNKRALNLTDAGGGSLPPLLKICGSPKNAERKSCQFVVTLHKGG